MSSTAVTLSRHILNEEEKHPEMAGELSKLLAQLGYAAKILSREIGRAALTGNLGLVGDKNATGDTQLNAVGDVLKVQLAQSAHFNLLDGERVRDTLRQMTRPQDQMLEVPAGSSQCRARSIFPVS